MGSYLYEKIQHHKLKHIFGMPITCVPICSFKQQHVSPQPQVLATHMKKSQHFQVSMNA